MKRTRLVLYTVLAAMILMGLPALAQGRETKFNVPFSFNVDKEVLPAGTYVVAQVFEASLMIRGASNGHATLVSSMGVESADREKPCKLVFHRYGNRYFLSQAWLGLRTSGRELLRSNEESEIARNAHPQTEYVLASEN